jgi:GNAT superfamily N-acetyltransferase
MDDAEAALTCTNTNSDGAVWGSSCSCRTGTSRTLGPVVPSRPATPDEPFRTRWEHRRMPVSSELSLRWVTSPAEVTPGLRADLTTCWRDVVNDGGAVGFAELVPVRADDVAPVVDEIAGGLDPRLGRLLIATRADTLAGWLLLTGNADPVVAHWARMTRLQTAPPARGTGVARALMNELHRSARDDLGLDSLRLEVRGGSGLEAFYVRFGWTVVGTWPGALQFTRHGRRDEVLMGKDLRSA